MNNIPYKLLLTTIILASLLLGACGGEANDDDVGNLKMALLSEMPAEVQNAPVSVQQAYQFNAANQGDRVTIELVSTDVVHGLAIDGTQLQMIADPGQTARLTFTAEEQGVYQFRCTTTCGNMHPFMVGKIRIGQNLLVWRAFGLASLALVAGIWIIKR